MVGGETPHAIAILIYRVLEGTWRHGWSAEGFANEAEARSTVEG